MIFFVLILYSIISGINTYEYCIIINKISIMNNIQTIDILKQISPLELLHAGSPDKNFNNIILKLLSKILISISGFIGLLLCIFIHECIYTLYNFDNSSKDIKFNNVELNNLKNKSNIYTLMNSSECDNDLKSLNSISNNKENKNDIWITIFIPKLSMWNKFSSNLIFLTRTHCSDIENELSKKLNRNVYIKEIVIIPENDCKSDIDIDNYLFNHFKHIDLQSETMNIKPFILINKNNISKYNSTFKHLILPVNDTFEMNELIEKISEKIK